jgi:DNA-binding GntR family transcriptional regulator
MRALKEGAGLVSRAAAAVREAITSGELSAGPLYSVNQIATQLAISRTPVREAVLRLSDAGVVQIERNRGFRVIAPNMQHIREIMEIRLLLEVPATRQAVASRSAGLADRLDIQLLAMHHAASVGDESAFVHHDRLFHTALLDAAGNGQLSAVVDGLRDRTLALGASTAGRSRTFLAIVDEHQPLLDAVRAGDAEAAAAAMREHLEHTRDLLLAQAIVDS